MLVVYYYVQTRWWPAQLSMTLSRSRSMASMTRLFLRHHTIVHWNAYINKDMLVVYYYVQTRWWPAQLSMTFARALMTRPFLLHHSLTHLPSLALPSVAHGQRDQPLFHNGFRQIWARGELWLRFVHEVYCYDTLYFQDKYADFCFNQGHGVTPF